MSLPAFFDLGQPQRRHDGGHQFAVQEVDFTPATASRLPTRSPRGRYSTLSSRRSSNKATNNFSCSQARQLSALLLGDSPNPRIDFIRLKYKFNLLTATIQPRASARRFPWFFRGFLQYTLQYHVSYLNCIRL